MVLVDSPMRGPAVNRPVPATRDGGRPPGQARSLAFAAANSSSVRMPACLSDASFWSSAVRSVPAAAGAAGGAYAGCAAAAA